MDDIDDILAYEDGTLSEDETVALFQRLVDSGRAWTLQGHYGRTATGLIDAGLVTRPVCRLCGHDIMRPDYTPRPHDAHGSCIVESGR